MSHLETLNVIILNETPKAYLFKDGENEAWFPKSQVSFKSRKGDKALAEIPLWLLTKAGWNE